MVTKLVPTLRRVINTATLMGQPSWFVLIEQVRLWLAIIEQYSDW